MTATSDVGLRDVREDDLAIFFEHQRDPTATRMAAFVPRDEMAFMAHWSSILRDERVTTKTVLAGGKVAGNVVSFDQAGRREVGYWIGREHWGKGVASAALSEFLAHDLTRPLYAHVAKDNVASIRVLQHCGFTICGEDTEFSKERDEDVGELDLILRASDRGETDESERSC